jgi:archaellum component FlaC
MRDTWRITKSLTNNIPNTPPLTFKGKTATTIQEKLNSFADNLKQILTTNSDVGRDFTARTGCEWLP